MNDSESQEVVPPAASSPEQESMHALVTSSVGVVLLAHFLLGVAFLVDFWPVKDELVWAKSARFLGWCFTTECTIDDAPRLFVIVLLAGGLGGTARALRSFADRVGARNIHKTYVWWYVLRPFEGAAIALLFYLVLRGGLVTTNANTTDISVFGAAAIAALVGMFSKEALAKLKEIAVSFFKEVKPASTSKPAANPKPILEKLVPQTITAGGDRQSIAVMGKNFVATSTVFIDDEPRAPVFKSATALELAMSKKDLQEAGAKMKIVIFNPLPGGGMSNEKTLTLTKQGDAPI